MLYTVLLNDEQLMAAFAITRGNITVRDGDEYLDLSLGDCTSFHIDRYPIEG